MSIALPEARTAEVQVIFTGYAGGRVASTVTFIRDGAKNVVIDPGMVPSQQSILGPLSAIGVAASDVSDVIFSHHHPDHTLNAGLFPEARFHDHWATYHHDQWASRRADGFAVTKSIRLIATPGHTAQDITTLVGTHSGLVACTHLWWSESGPSDDPLAEDLAALHHWRAELLAMQELRLIIPGHGAPFAPSAHTVR